MKKNSFHKDNRGASLLAVLILMVVVSAIAVVITKITIVNIQMKEVERGTKKNFYSADAIMDDLRTGAREQAETALENAYADVLQHYVDYTSGGKNAQDVFKQKYMNGLENYFADPMKTPVDTTNHEGNVVYRVAGYDTGKVKACILDGTQQDCFVAPADPKYEIDYGAGTFTLKGVRVVYKDAQDYETTITTDLVFSTPDMNFSGQSQVKEFMKYALIADQQININAGNVTVNGSAYAGKDGILANNNGSGVIAGKTIITRGDIATKEGCALSIGNGNSSIWAENIQTTGNSSSTINIDGTAYVADDLALNGRESRVTLKGRYYGYNFQKNYGTGDTVSTDADYSSAIMINGKNSNLDMKGLKYLMLAGRTFISRKTDTKNSDILMGESLAARTNQLAYYVPAEYVDTATGKFLYREAGGTGIQAYDGMQEYATRINIAKDDLEAMLNSERPLVPYYYSGGVNYYLNFKSQQDANKFFSTYFDQNSGKIAGMAGVYLDKDALIINNNLIMTLNGDIMYRTASDAAFQEKAVTIQPDNWIDGTGLFWNFCSKMAVRYKSLELGLKDNGQGVTVDNVRIMGTDENGHEIVDKGVDPLFDKLIDRAAMVQEIEAHNTSSNPAIRVYNPVADVYLIENDAKEYRLSNAIAQGIVVATGDVVVEGNFDGLIISGGRVSFNDNASLKSNKLLVTDLFTEDQKRTTPLFSQFFRDCPTSAAANISTGFDFDSYISYDGWKKY